MDYNETFLKRCIMVGTITLSIALVCNFIPAIYIWIAYGEIPNFADLGKILAINAALHGLSWLMQPISYFPVLGTSGTYVTWLAGSGADIRTPASSIAQKAAGVEMGSPEGNVISTLAITTSVFVTVLIITLFTFIGTAVMPLLPKFIISSFKFILPAIFAAVLMNFARKNLDVCASIAVVACGLLYLQRFVVKFPDWLAMLVLLLVGISFAHFKYKLIQKKTVNS
ncbi:hypothetical protein SRRS_34280 [Sporomusa rhizae]|uniref:hypothetical protein n=1 Tax=Sporomusa rhizae TaxID=357999 RepID=UPI00352B5F6B